MSNPLDAAADKAMNQKSRDAHNDLLDECLGALRHWADQSTRTGEVMRLAAYDEAEDTLVPAVYEEIVRWL